MSCEKCDRGGYGGACICAAFPDLKPVSLEAKGEAPSSAEVLEMFERKMKGMGGGLPLDPVVTGMELSWFGFDKCSQCGALHIPVKGVCGYRLVRDAATTLHACGTPLSLDMIGRVLSDLDIKEGYRYVSSAEQRHAYLMAGGVISKSVAGDWREKAADGAAWVTRTDYPADVLLIETSGGHGVITGLWVKGD